MDGSQIPIIRLTVDNMRYAILQALNPELLSEQLRIATENALKQMDFTRMIHNEIYHIAEEVLKDEDLIEPVRDFIYTQLQFTINKVIPQINDSSSQTKE
jgi:hypothetical protein